MDQAGGENRTVSASCFAFGFAFSLRTLATNNNDDDDDGIIIIITPQRALIYLSPRRARLVQVR